MAELHSALKALSPVTFSDVPASPEELDTYISDIFANAELIIESVPIPSPDEISTRARSATVSSMASNTSEMSSSSARSATSSPKHTALQKEWGKPYKVNSKENPLNISVYKLGGKDGRGAWFARRSVHEGLGFARFKKGLESEFSEAMKLQGGPGEGSIRGIGGERRVEEIHVDGKGKVEVYYLTAQFPGPTAPRDFVTMTVTSSRAMNESHKTDIPELCPRHYMMVSKPCTHPECPQKDGMVRGFYESVEFIREVPRRPRKTMSSSDLSRGGRRSPNLEHEALLRSGGKHVSYEHENRSADNLPRTVSRSPSGRQRGVTVGQSEGIQHKRQSIYDDYDPEANPVEWIMITRSDPGGGIPRFMVERGTPASIVADAYKFLDWATKLDEPTPTDRGGRPSMPPERRESFQSWQANGHLAGINGKGAAEDSTFPSATVVEEDAREAEPAPQSGMLGALTSTLNAYAPQSVLDRLPGQYQSLKPATEPFPPPPTSADAMYEPDDADASSITSSTSFASADSHLGDTDEQQSISSSLVSPGKDKQPLTPHDKELKKLAQRRVALDKKLESTREKLKADNDNQTAKEKEAIKKAEEKHEKEMNRQEEKYKREVRKLEEKKEKEAKKLEERKKREADKDEKARLTRERDEAREELDILKKEQEIWQKQVGDLQRENTRLIARVGKLEGMDGSAVKALMEEEKGHTRTRSKTTGPLSGETRSRSSSIKKSNTPSLESKS